MPTYSLDGVALDHPAGCWRLKPGTRRRPLPGVRSVEVTVPGRAGELPIVGLDHETTQLPLEFGVTSRAPGGGDGGYVQLEENLEALSALLGVRHRLMTLRYEAGPIVRVADVTITAVSEPEVNVGAARARLTAVVRVPGVYWRDEVTTTWTGSANAADQAVTTLAGSTGPITDALIRITGPAVNPAVVDVATGGTVARSSGLLGSERLLIDCAAMRAAKVTSDTWDLAAGTDVTGQITATGPGSAFRWLHLTPAVGVGDPFSRVVLLTATATSTTGASKLEVRARRSYI
ncbi:hypothetical protein ABZ470_39540 [Streptosporangium sp. NPDC020072]|uniref:hypothetical protein n=1 Tax=Streptosporangium sp. NPDC020072 TaxID=3154788 RepID=UPI0034159317